MAAEHLAELVTNALYEVAPDLKGDPLDPAEKFNVQFEFDSMDFLRFVASLHRATGLELPERDYPRLMSLESAVGYLAEKLAQ
jgi:acyl carrier protein